jgi:hypothetical protein
MWPKILLAVGIVGIIMGGIALVITAILAAGNGHVSPAEAAPGFLGGGCCCSLSLVLAIVGLVLVLKARKQPPTPPAPPGA